MTIAVVGKYTVLKDAYKSLIRRGPGPRRGGQQRQGQPRRAWVESETFEGDPGVAEVRLAGVHGVASWCPAASASAGPRSKISARGAVRPRAPDPLFRHLLRHADGGDRGGAERGLGIKGASSTEFGPTMEPVVGLMTEWVKGNQRESRAAGDNLGGTMRLGAYEAILKPDSKVCEIYMASMDISELPPPSLRGQHRLSRGDRRRGAEVLRPVARRRPARDRRARRPPLVRRRAVSSGAEVAPLRPAPAVPQLHRRGDGTEPAGVDGGGPVRTRASHCGRKWPPVSHTYTALRLGPLGHRCELDSNPFLKNWFGRRTLFRTATSSSSSLIGCLGEFRRLSQPELRQDFR